MPLDNEMDSQVLLHSVLVHMQPAGVVTGSPKQSATKSVV